MNIVLVCGGRDYDNRRMIHDTLDGLVPEPSVVVTGGAPGADTIASGWADYNGIHSVNVYPMWHTHGKKAGVLRNQLMIDLFDINLVVAFPGGDGTADMVRRAKAANIPVIEVQDG